MELYKKQAYNYTLEQSSEYQRILPEVMREVYTTFVNNRIAQKEPSLLCLQRICLLTSLT